MGNHKWNRKMNHRLTPVLAGLFAVFTILLGFFCIRYYQDLNKTLETESKGYLKEISNRIGDNIVKTVNHNYAMLESISLTLGAMGTDNFNDFTDVVNKQKENWDFKSIFLIDENGIGYGIDGNTISLEGDKYLRQTIMHQEPAMSIAESVNNEEVVIFAIPINNGEVKGKKIAALAATYEPSSFEAMLSMKSFDGLAFSQLVDKDGTIALRSSSTLGLSMGYNTFTTIANSSSIQEKELDEVKSRIAKDKSGQLAFSLNDEKMYMTYIPINHDDWYLLTFVPSAVVNAKSTLFLQATLVFCGFIFLMFVVLFGYILFSYTRNRKHLEKIAYIDIVTKGHSLQRFYELCEDTLYRYNGQYVMIHMNIDKFKMVNEEIGRDNGDIVLRYMDAEITKLLREHESIGHITGDTFAILCEYESSEVLLKRIDTWYDAIIAGVKQQLPGWNKLSLKFGIYIIKDTDVELPDLIDRARLALRETSIESKTNTKVRYAFYNETVREHLLREKELEDMMEEALREEEFQVYIQPKYDIRNGEVGGGEALVRWISKKEGMIYPDTFIPLFEKNGFVIRLDLWVFNKVCETLQRWQDEGKPMVRISVNCSRMHLHDPNFMATYKKIFDQYQIPPKYIELELTESIVYDNIDELKRIIDEIHKLGFVCSMDDFGSGYSSLNLIQALPFDILKIDRIFFCNEDADNRSHSVIHSIVHMAKALSMETVAEGVEDEKQVTMLREMDCEYIQGYVFAKPMPIREFEIFITKK